MDAPKTSISAGLVIGAMLAEDTDISRTATKVFPVLVESAELPFVAYRCVGMDSQPQKGGLGADTLDVEVICMAGSYGESVRLAEMVRAAIDSRQAEARGLVMRGCHLYDREESANEDKTFMQRLVFRIRV